MPARQTFAATVLARCHTGSVRPPRRPPRRRARDRALGEPPLLVLRRRLGVSRQERPAPSDAQHLAAPQRTLVNVADPGVPAPIHPVRTSVFPIHLRGRRCPPGARALALANLSA